MSRRSAREHAFTLLFQWDFSESEDMKEQMDFYLEQIEDLQEADKIFILQEVEGVLEKKEQIDGLISKYAKGWAITRMAKVDLAILRLAIYELCYREDIPNSVAVNEAVELAKKFSGDEAPAFINGILGKVASEEVGE